METKEKFDITKFEEGTAEIIKHMDYLPPDDDVRMGILMGFVGKVMGI